jgi:phosphoribosylformimino-5-aminoimidazole carboxamide ribonucleotide (ProFAR) isomerase
MKVTVKVTVGVYLPRDSLADRAASKSALLERLYGAGDWSSDGRRNLSVEQLHAAAETVVRNAIERIVDGHLRSEDQFQAIRIGGPEGNRAYKEFENCFALAMARVIVNETPISDEHVLEFEIEEPE